MSLLYWIPDHRQPQFTLEHAAERGLDYAFDDRHRPVGRGCDKGPDGQRGMVVSADTMPGYYPDRQEWREMVDSPGGLQVGRWTDRDVKPEHLARERLIAGNPLRLPDGNKWLVPVARRWTDEDGEIYPVASLPRIRTYQGDGLWAPGDVTPRCRRLWQLAIEYASDLQQAIAAGERKADGTVSYLLPRSRDEVAVEALRVNYRVGPDELSLLGLWDDEVPDQIIHVLLDSERLAVLLKKKEESQAQTGGSSCSGAEPSTTEQPATTAPQ